MKSYKECCSEVAIKYKLGKSLVTGHLPKYWEEAAENYASQFKFSENIWRKIEDEWIDWCFNGLGKFASNHEIFKWYKAKIDKHFEQ